MKTIPILSLLFITVLNFTVYGQHILNTDSILKSNEIKNLNVYNCMGEECIRDYYEFNRNGQIIKKAPVKINYYITWEYFENGKLKSTSTKQHCCDTDSIQSSKLYYYKLNGELDYSIYKEYENGKMVKSDSILREKRVKEKNEIPTTRNDNKQIIEQELYDLFYPCGITFEGKHTIKYSYTSDGLLANGKIYSQQNKLIVDLKYEYEKY